MPGPRQMHLSIRKCTHTCRIDLQRGTQSYVYLWGAATEVIRTFTIWPFPGGFIYLTNIKWLRGNGLAEMKYSDHRCRLTSPKSSDGAENLILEKNKRPEYFEIRLGCEPSSCVKTILLAHEFHSFHSRGAPRFGLSSNFKNPRLKCNFL